MLKRMIVGVIRPTARAYIRYAPWSGGKSAVYDFFDRHIAGRQYRARVRTLFAGPMELCIPDLISTTIYLTGRWEPLITRYIRANLKRGDTFVDVGANIGYYDLIASRIVAQTGRVFAIEASPSIYSRLVRNLALNNCTNITAIHAAAQSSKWPPAASASRRTTW